MRSVVIGIIRILGSMVNTTGSSSVRSGANIPTSAVVDIDVTRESWYHPHVQGVANGAPKKLLIFLGFSGLWCASGGFGNAVYMLYHRFWSVPQRQWLAWTLFVVPLVIAIIGALCWRVYSISARNSREWANRSATEYMGQFHKRCWQDHCVRLGKSPRDPLPPLNGYTKDHQRVFADRDGMLIIKDLHAVSIPRQAIRAMELDEQRGTAVLGVVTSSDSHPHLHLPFESNETQWRSLVALAEFQYGVGVRRKVAKLASPSSESVIESPTSISSQADQETVMLTKQYDVFISHASEDKEQVARPLANMLKDAGLAVWYDEFELKIGDSLRRAIDRGLSTSRFGVVVLSPYFITKGWTGQELDGLMARAVADQQILLPIWHNISKDKVMDYSPLLVDRVARQTATHTLQEIANEIIQRIREHKRV